MDNLTHSLVGLMLARVGFEKTTPRGAGMMVLAANAPDIDAAFWFGGTLPYLEWHRTYPHALAFVPLMALLPMLLVRARFSWQSYVASIVGVLSHVLLDWTNSYGIPLALPFSWHRFRLDLANVFDIWIWAILLAAVAATALSRLVSGEIGAVNGTGARRGWAWAALAALLAYEGLRLITHARAVQMMSARLYQGAPPRRVTALPGAFNPLAWRGVVEGEDFVVILPVDLLAEFDPASGPGAGRIYPTAPQIPALDAAQSTRPFIDAALSTRPFQVFSRWSQLPYWKVTPVEGGTRLDLIDLRFGTPERPGFASVAAVVDSMGNVLRAGFGI